MESLALIVALVGFVFLFFGRQMFWLFSALSGFVLGALVGTFIARDIGTAGIVVIGLMAGGLFAVLSIYVQKPMAALAGFVLGGAIVALLYVVVRSGGSFLLYGMYGLSGDLGNTGLLLFMLGGILSAVLVWVTFEWALIVLSSLFGALLVWPSTLLLLPLSGASSLLPLLVLAALGIFVQARLLAKPTVVVAPLPPSSQPPVSRP